MPKQPKQPKQPKEPNEPNEPTPAMQIGSPAWMQMITTGAAELGVIVNQDHLDRFARHAAELLSWNRKINLTAITDPVQVAVKHVIDSVAPAAHLAAARRLLDIGSGGGFPGIPLKIVLPQLSVTLIDATRKKVSFLRHVIRTLQLENIEALHVRAHELSKNRSFAAAFDVVICRAFSSLASFVKLARPLLAHNGVIMAMKAKAADSEINALDRLFSYDSNDLTPEPDISYTIAHYTLPYLGSQRTIICLRIRS